MANSIKERIYKFDNIKLLTILLVVVGHVIEPYTKHSDMFRSLFIFIYSFHMPLFIFISGLFQKRFSDTNKLKINKVAYYVILGFSLKILNALCRMVKSGKFKMDVFGGGAIDWFLFVLSMFMITAYLLRKVHPAITLSIAFVLGSVCGYFPSINDDMWLSRYFVFLPIYLIGYYMTPELLIKIEKKGGANVGGRWCKRAPHSHQNGANYQEIKVVLLLGLIFSEIVDGDSFGGLFFLSIYNL